VVLFRRVAAQLGWTEKDYKIKCIEDYSQLLDHMNKGDGARGFMGAGALSFGSLLGCCLQHQPFSHTPACTHSLQSSSGEFDMGFGGLSETKPNMDAGWSFSVTTIRTGYRILVPSETYQVSYFMFLDAFKWQLWLAIICTCVFVGFAVWLLDPFSRAKGPKLSDYGCLSLRSRVWTALANSLTFSVS